MANTTPNSSLHLTANILRYLAPRALWRRRLAGWDWGTPDPEMRLLPWLCDKRRISVDIGACLGIYTMAMLCHSKACVTFEARPNQAAALKKIFGEMRAPVTVHSAALSDREGSTPMRICLSDLGRSSVSGDHDLPGEVETIHVQTRRLDDYNLKDVGCIKIDVEGHEDAVLAGAEKTLQDSRPSILVELDDNRNPGRIDATCTWLARLNYQAWFLLDGRLLSVSEFNPAAMHVPDREPYVCNFIFVQPDVAARLPARV